MIAYKVVFIVWRNEDFNEAKVYYNRLNEHKWKWEWENSQVHKWNDKKNHINLAVNPWYGYTFSTNLWERA